MLTSIMKGYPDFTLLTWEVSILCVRSLIVDTNASLMCELLQTTSAPRGSDFSNSFRYWYERLNPELQDTSASSTIQIQRNQGSQPGI